MSRLRIDRLEIRLGGGSRHRAREIAAELPREIARRLADERLAPGEGRARIAVPTVRTAAGTGAAETAGAVAGAVARALGSRGTDGGGRR